jgi:hypothetical protein
MGILEASCGEKESDDRPRDSLFVEEYEMETFAVEAKGSDGGIRHRFL